MKKNISINISGIIFHIEEDGYERLKAYLESINRYFSTFEDSEEIIADIESRIAEIFLTHLKEGKQVITAEDVEQLMATMGSIRDFQTIEDPLEEPPHANRTYEESSRKEGRKQQTADGQPYARKKLYRDEKKKVLGGVAAGIANYFNVDPLWVRLLLVVILLDLFVTFSISTFVLIGYIICWIVIPGSMHLDDDKKVKRLYRNPDERVIGGVSSGLAAYFGADPIVIRILFILSLFLGGSGLIIYLVLWAIMPPARTLTEKMQMQGEPVTLSNIEQNIRKSLNVKDGEEDTLAKIILFPFRLIAAVFRGFGSMAGPLLLFLGDLLRILLGVVLVVLGLSFFFVSVSLLGITSGLADPDLLISTDVRLDILLQSIPDVGAIALFGVTFVLSILMIIGGFMLITKRSLIKPVIGWTLFAVLIVSMILMAISASVTVNDFRREGSIEVTKDFGLPQGTTVLKLGNNPSEDFEEVELRIRSYEGDRISLEQTFEARGRNSDVAEQNAKMILYDVEMEDSVITFDQSFDYADDAVFRNQRVRLDLQMPRQVPFILDRNLYRILDWNSNRFRRYTGEEVMFDENGALECLSCPQPRSAEPDSVDWDRMEGESEVSLEPFSDIEVSESFTVSIRKGPEYKAEIPGDLEGDIGLEVNGDRLSIRYTGNMRLNDDDVTERTNILITLPDGPRQVDLRDRARVRIHGFDQDRMEVNAEGESYLLLNGTVDELSIEQTGNSKVTLRGKGESLEANLFSDAILQAVDYPCEDGRIEASGASRAMIHITEKLRVEASGNSEVLYLGDASQDTSTYGSARVQPYE